jgi:hypothetical protein
MEVAKRVLLSLALGAAFGGIIAMELAPSAIMMMVNPSIAPISPSAMCPCIDAATKVERALATALNWQVAGHAMGGIGGVVVGELLVRFLRRRQGKAATATAPTASGDSPPPTATG